MALQLISDLITRLCFIVSELLLFLCSGARVQIPGAALQRGSDPKRDERSGEEEHSQDPRLMHHAGLLLN